MVIMHLIFERSKGKFRSNCNILSLAWMPYYNEIKFRQSLYEYNQRQLFNLANLNNNQPPNQALDQLAHNNNNDLNNRQVHNNNQLDANQSHNNQILNGHEQPFANSRIAELYQRYLYIGDSRIDQDRSAILDSAAICQELDLKYGRSSEFGWLAIGNVGKIVGVTLTTTIPPIAEEPQRKSKASKSCHKNQGDLIQFTDHDEDTRKQETTCNNDAMIAGPSCHRTNTNRPDKNPIRQNYNLRGHLDEIILVRWNELYQKLATVDSKGNVLIWCKLNEKFTIQTPFYNRTKSVTDFRWSNDGKTALICYTNSFILVGSSSGQRHWHSMLNLDDYHITCASWTPNDEQLLLGVSNGNVVVIDLPHSELTELVVNQYNIRTMCWSTCDMNLKYVSVSRDSGSNNSSPSSFSERRSSFNQRVNNTNSTSVVNHRRLSRDCSVFSRYRFCSQAPNNTSIQSASSNSARQTYPMRRQQQVIDQAFWKQRNVLAIDFANNTVKLYDGGLEDLNPKVIYVNQESYIMHWSSDGKVLAIAGFTIHTSAPSVGMLKCRYLNTLKFYDQQGSLIYEYVIKYTRYPITAFTWAHDDTRIFVATGPKLHCAKVYFRVPTLSLLATSCLHKHTKLADKVDVLENIVQNRHFASKIFKWQSHNCPIDIYEESKKSLPKKVVQQMTSDAKQQVMMGTDCNNSNVFQYKLPHKLQTRIDDLFVNSIRQPYDEQWSLNDIIWHVPKNNNQRYYCTLVCYTCDRDISSSGYQYRTDLGNKMSEQNTSDQNKIFVLYVEFQGSLIPILRARRVGFLKPEFVIFDPEDNQSKFNQRQQRKVSDISQQSFLQSHFIQKKFQEAHSNQFGPLVQRHQDIDYSLSPTPNYCYEGFPDNCSNLHNNASNGTYNCNEFRESNSSHGRLSMSDAEHYYNFSGGFTDNELHSPTKHLDLNDHNQQTMSNLINNRSHCQEPMALPMASNPYLFYMLALSSGHRHFQTQSKSGYQTNNIPSSISKRLIGKQDRQKLRNTTGLSTCLTENNELLRIKSNIWGTKFKLINTGNRMIKQQAVLGSVVYKASILHLQPRQIFLNIKNMSNYCSLCSKHHHTRIVKERKPAQPDKNLISLLDLPNGGSSQMQSLLNSSTINSNNRRRRPTRKRSSDQKSGDKIILPVGDGIRIVPKLEKNQVYKFAGTNYLQDNQKPSTSGGLRSSPKMNQINSPNKTRHRNDRFGDSQAILKPVRSKHFACDNLRSQDSFGSGNAITDATTNDDDDDILTLSLSQSNQVQLDLRLSTNDVAESSAPRLNEVDQFLAANKTLKSIQSITKMIVDLSAKVDDDELSTNDEPVTGGELDSNSISSPVKMQKLEGVVASSPQRAYKYITPDPPIHRPRRMATSSKLTESKQFYHQQTQSATTTPLRLFDSTGKRSSRLHKDSLEQHLEPFNFEKNPLPPPPPAVPIGRRLSSTAKRFFDGSLRSLYSGYTTSDAEPEENEPLVRGGGRRKGASNNKFRSFNQSQPCTPLKGFIENEKRFRQVIDLSSLRSQLTEKISRKSSENRKQQQKERKACSVSSNQLNSYTESFARKLRIGNLYESSTLSSSSSSLSSSFSSSSSISGLSSPASPFRVDERDLQDSGIESVARAGKTKSRLRKYGFLSNSVKNLKEFEGVKQQQQQREALWAGRQATKLQEQLNKREPTRRQRDRRRRNRRKSICSNNNCCCAREFKLNNRPPVWNESSQVYQLDFGGRVTQESAKNLQIDFEGNLALQFGRIDRCTYTLDYMHPFNAVQAMAIALASLTQRLK